MAIAVGIDRPEIDAVLLSFLLRWGEPGENELFDPVQEVFGNFELDVAFWKEVGLAFGYIQEIPTLLGFVRTLFRAANPLDRGVSLNAHGQVFLQHWKDSQIHSPSYRRWAESMERDLNLNHQLDAMEDTRAIGGNDTFPAFERFSLHSLCRAFEQEEMAPDEILKRIQHRGASIWYQDHYHGYAALERAVQLRQLLASAELQVESLDAGIQRYTATWHRVDRAYRKFHFHARSYGQVALLERICDRVEKTYVSNFSLPLADRWGDQVAKLDAWPGEIRAPSQTRFFERYVQPFIAKEQKVCVVVSDALRYEAASELMDRLLGENRWKAELDAMVAALPSYTQLGMAALLPGKDRSLDPAKRTVSIDGRETSGIEARREILATKAGCRATARRAVAFMEMNTATEARALIRDHDVVYLYHNVIDDTGDKLATEALTTEAVEEALEGLLKLLKKIANANGNHVVLTADHGFLFQQSELADEDDLPLPSAAGWLFQHRRFALGRGIEATPDVKTFSAAALGLNGDWEAAFPRSLGRFPLRGSGKRFVHGGISLQEVVVPVMRIQKTRTDDTGRVEVDLLRAPAKITTGRVTLTLYQDSPTARKVLGRTLRVGVFSSDGKPISEFRTVTFNFSEPDARNREVVVDLALSRASDAYNGQEVEIHLEEIATGSQSALPYKIHRLKLQKPFATDFDEF